MPNTENKRIPRSPVVVIMGHIDHGKSTLLDYIRNTHVVDEEAGGITQHVAAYEAKYTFEGKERGITFLDTPGHAAFTSVRKNGSEAADIAVLVVSAEDGVKPQTLEALQTIQSKNVPFIVAITKIDKSGASIDKTKQSLAENELFVEGWGGTIPCVPISAKTGEGVNDLLDMILLQADLLELTGDKDALASGIVIESNMDAKRGISATLIIKDGSINKGMFVATIGAYAPVRLIENFQSEQIEKASFSSPIRIVGWSDMPRVGSEFITFESKKEAEEFANKKVAESQNTVAFDSETEFPVIVKADTQGSLDAVLGELAKLSNPKIGVKIVGKGIGLVSESDIKNALVSKALTVAFNVDSDKNAKALALREKAEVKVFNIIYELIDFVAERLTLATPKERVEVVTGKTKILKAFSSNKDKQVLGGRVEEGEMRQGDNVKIIRRESEIGEGKIKEIQSQKQKVGRVEQGQEFGVTIESKIEIVPGDYIHAINFENK